MPTFIKSIIKLLLFIVLAAIPGKGLLLAQVKFSTVVSERQPGINDYIQVEYTVENAKSVERIDPPMFKDLRLIQGPMQSNGMSYINGVMSQYKSISFILQPLVKGKIVIQGATAVADGRTLRSESVRIEVKNLGSAGGNNKSNSFNNLFPGMSPMLPDDPLSVDEDYVLKPGESIAEKIKKNLFVKADVNKTTCYEGEPIMATFILCSRLRSESKVVKRPSLNGFSVYDMVDPESNRPTVQNINGQPYNVHLIRKTQLIPLQSGTFVIDPVELDNKVTVLKRPPGRGGSANGLQRLMDELADGTRGEIEEHTVRLSSKPILVTVKPLPVVNKPESFNGAVGKFDMRASCKNKVVAAGEQIVLQILITGAGNLPVINPPLVAVPAGMEAFDPVTKEKLDKSIYPLNGSKTFNYTFVARDSGRFKIAGVVFSYFNPAENTYKTLTSDSFFIRVLPAPRKKGGRLLSDVSRISTGGTKWFDAVDVNILIGILTIVIVSILALYQWKKNRMQRASRSLSTIQQSPQKAAFSLPQSDPFEGARLQLARANSLGFYNEVNRSVWKVLADQFNVPSTELNKFNMINQLQNQGADSELVLRLQSLMNECEIALYTPIHNTTDMEETLARAESIIKDIKTSFT